MFASNDFTWVFDQQGSDLKGLSLQANFSTILEQLSGTKIGKEGTELGTNGGLNRVGHKECLKYAGVYHRTRLPNRMWRSALV